MNIRTLVLLGISLLLLTPRNLSAQGTAAGYITYEGRDWPLYPQQLLERPTLPSPCTTEDGSTVIVARTSDGHWLIFEVTVEDGDPLDYKQWTYGKGRQLTVDAADFPTLARTGFHSERELDTTTSITGRSVVEITRIGHPMEYSGAGFLREDEDIISVLEQDDRLARTLGLTHAELARPLFHLWNIVVSGILRDVWLQEQMGVESILYHGVEVRVDWQGGRGWQESIFDDEILGQYHLEMRREMEPADRTFLEKAYPDLNQEELDHLIERLSYIHTGEMVPYYIMRYGFYEGHTDFRADPIAIAYIFKLKGIAEIEDGLKGRLFELLVQQPPLL